MGVDASCSDADLALAALNSILEIQRLEPKKVYDFLRALSQHPDISVANLSLHPTTPGIVCVQATYTGNVILTYDAAATPPFRNSAEELFAALSSSTSIPLTDCQPTINGSSARAYAFAGEVPATNRFSGIGSLEVILTKHSPST